jgi:MFS family permease
MADALDSDARWAAAAALARNAAVPQKRSRRWWTWAWIGASVIAVGAIAFSLASWIALVGGGEGVGSVPSRPAVQTTLIALALLVLTYGVFWASVTERYVERTSTIMSPLSRAERRSVRRQLAGKAPTDESKIAIILAIARQNQRITEGSVPQFVSLFFYYAWIEVGAVDSTAAYMPYLRVAVATTLIGSTLYLVIVYARTARFIRAYPVPATARDAPVGH